MTTNHLKTGVEQSAETSFISNIPETVDSVKHNTGVVRNV
jgi:hypothetical protein